MRLNQAADAGATESDRSTTPVVVPPPPRLSVSPAPPRDTVVVGVVVSGGNASPTVSRGDAEDTERDGGGRNDHGGPDYQSDTRAHAQAAFDQCALHEQTRVGSVHQGCEPRMRFKKSRRHWRHDLGSIGVSVVVPPLRPSA